jgi:hypothetical protein
MPEVPSRQESTIAFLSRLLLAIYLIEAGFLLVMAPWTPLWHRNYFAALWPWLDVLMSNGFVRGAVSGVGLITAWAGVRDLSSAFMARWSAGK